MGSPLLRSTTSASLPASSAASSIQSSRSPPLRKITSAAASASTSSGAARSRAGRCSAQDLVHVEPLALDLPAQSATCVVVATTRTPESPSLPQAPSATSAGAANRPPRSAGPRPRSAHARPPDANTAPESVAIVAPGGAFSSTDSASPAMPSTATRATVDRLPWRQAVGPQAHGRGRHDDQRGHQQRAERRQRGHDHERDQGQQHAVGQPPAHAERRRGGRGRTRAPATPAERSVAATAPALATPASSEVARLDQQQAAEQQRLHPTPSSNTSLARITPSASIPARPTAVVASGPRRRPSSAAITSANAPAAASAPSGAAKPRPSASTRPGNAALPTAWE